MVDLAGKARVAARFAHMGQIDKNGMDYFEHLSAVALMVKQAGGSDEAIAAAWLHDIIEDTPCGEQDLRSAGFPPVVVEAVLLLTHTHEHSHEDYLRRIVEAPGFAGVIAMRVKIADVIHNADPERGGWADENWLTKRKDKALAILQGTNTCS